MKKTFSTPTQNQAALTMFAAGVVLLLAMLFGIGNGTLNISPNEIFSAIQNGVFGNTSDSISNIIWNLRLPRVMMAALVGASLASAGAAMQGLFRNPLADPYLLGAASGASLGATIALVASGSLATGFAASAIKAGGFGGLVPLASFVGALGAVMLTLTISKFIARQQPARQRPDTLILCGVIVGSLMVSLSTYLMLRDADRLRAAFSFGLGNLAQVGWQEFTRVLPYSIFGGMALLLLARALDALQLGPDTARTLGINTERTEFISVVAASLLTAAAVSAVGLIGFVGLVAPHTARRLVGPLHKNLIPTSALIGAALLVLADLVARTIIRPAELPVGIITTALGVPFFLWLLGRKT